VAVTLQQSPGAGHVALATVIAEHAVMADADQPGGENVPRETPDELDGAQGE
jgi:hypothetical protein